ARRGRRRLGRQLLGIDSGLSHRPGVALLLVTSTLLFALALGRIHDQVLGIRAARLEDDEADADRVDGNTPPTFLHARTVLSLVSEARPRDGSRSVDLSRCRATPGEYITPRPGRSFANCRQDDRVVGGSCDTASTS